MINSIIFEGENIKIKYKSNKMIKFILEDKLKRHRATICCYNDKYFKLIESSIGEILIVTGEFYETFAMGKNGDWVDSYTIRAKSIKKA